MDLDIVRSLNAYPKGLSKRSREALRSQLSKLIKRVLRSEPQLSYFQGYHDLAACLLLVMGRSRATRALQHLSLFYIRDAMQSSLEPVMRQLDLIPILLRLADRDLYGFLKQCEVPPYYALSWVLTWGTHNVMNLELAARLVEYVLASHPSMPIYIAAALTLNFRAEIISLEPDYALVHTSLSKLFGRLVVGDTPGSGEVATLGVEVLLGKAGELFRRYPLSRLERASGAAWLHPNSCLLLYDRWFMEVEPLKFKGSLTHIEGLLGAGDLQRPIPRSMVLRRYLGGKLVNSVDGFTLCVGVAVLLGFAWSYHTGGL